jgi:hypothetical protein
MKSFLLSVSSVGESFMIPPAGALGFGQKTNPNYWTQGKVV